MRWADCDDRRRPDRGSEAGGLLQQAEPLGRLTVPHDAVVADGLERERLRSTIAEAQRQLKGRIGRLTRR